MPDHNRTGIWRVDVYELPYDPMRPVVCMDEKPSQHLGDAKEPLPSSIFAFVEPLGGKHHVSVHEHLTAIDWAPEIRYLSDVMYPDAEKIIVVINHLNTHKPASLYKAFPPADARRIIKRLKTHTLQSMEVGWIWQRLNDMS